MVNKICDLSYFSPSAHLDSSHLRVTDVGRHIHLSGDFFFYTIFFPTLLLSH